MKKKVIVILLVVAVLVGMLITLVSCNSTDKNENNSSKKEKIEELVEKDEEKVSEKEIDWLEIYCNSVGKSIFDVVGDGFIRFVDINFDDIPELVYSFTGKSQASNVKESVSNSSFFYAYTIQGEYVSRVTSYEIGSVGNEIDVAILYNQILNRYQWARKEGGYTLIVMDGNAEKSETVGSDGVGRSTDLYCAIPEFEISSEVRISSDMANDELVDALKEAAKGYRSNEEIIGISNDDNVKGNIEIELSEEFDIPQAYENACSHMASTFYYVSMIDINGDEAPELLTYYNDNAGKKVISNIYTLNNGYAQDCDIVMSRASHLSGTILSLEKYESDEKSYTVVKEFSDTKMVTGLSIDLAYFDGNEYIEYFSEKENDASSGENVKYYKVTRKLLEYKEEKVELTEKEYKNNVDKINLELEKMQIVMSISEENKIKFDNMKNTDRLRAINDAYNNYEKVVSPNENISE